MYDDARKASENAKIFVIIGIAIGGITWTVALIASVLSFVVPVVITVVATEQAKAISSRY